MERFDGQRVNSSASLNAFLWRHKPGDRVKLVFVDRSRRSKEATITLTEIRARSRARGNDEWRRSHRRAALVS